MKIPIFKILRFIFQRMHDTSQTILGRVSNQIWEKGWGVLRNLKAQYCANRINYIYRPISLRIILFFPSFYLSFAENGTDFTVVGNSNFSLTSKLYLHANP